MAWVHSSLESSNCYSLAFGSSPCSCTELGHNGRFQTGIWVIRQHTHPVATSLQRLHNPVSQITDEIYTFSAHDIRVKCNSLNSHGTFPWQQVKEQSFHKRNRGVSTEITVYLHISVFSCSSVSLCYSVKISWSLGSHWIPGVWIREHIEHS